MSRGQAPRVQAPLNLRPEPWRSAAVAGFIRSCRRASSRADVSRGLSPGHVPNRRLAVLAHGALEQERVDEGLRQVSAQLALLHVELLREEGGRPAGGAVAL